MFKLDQALCTYVVQELGVVCQGTGAECAKERVMFGHGVQSCSVRATVQDCSYSSMAFSSALGIHWCG